MSKPLRPRKTPCPSCPYRRGVPSGIWSEAEYDKLPGYDGPTGEQAAKGALGVFMCHQGDPSDLCAGWVGCHDMGENLAVRVAAALGETVDLDAIHAYESPVPLFGSGAEAAEHGKRDIAQPSQRAQAAAGKIAAVRRRRGRPVKESS